MIIGIVKLAALAGDDAPRAAVPGARRPHGIFAVVATSLYRQTLLKVSEHEAVALVWKRAALADQRDRLARLGRQFGSGDLRRHCRGWRLAARQRGRHRQQQPQQGCQQYCSNSPHPSALSSP